MNKWALSLALVLLCVSTAVAQEPAATAMGTPAPVAATDATVMRLSNAYLETAERIHTFVVNKDHIATSPLRLKSELKKVGMFLLPMRDDIGTTLTPEQETAAMAVLRNDSELSRYANQVQKLWEQTKYTSPLAPRFIAKTIAPDVVDALDGEYVDDGAVAADDSSSLVFVVLAVTSILLVVAILIALNNQKKKRETARRLLEEETKNAEKEAEKLRKQRELEALKAAEDAQKEQVKNANDYQIDTAAGEFALSRDFRKDIAPLSVPTRKEVNGSFTLVFRNAEGETVQKIKMSKRVMSFGRATEGTGTADISLKTADQSVSRLHGVLLYREIEQCWLLALNQLSERNVNCSARYALLKKADSSELKPAVVFVLHKGDTVYFVSNEVINQIGEGRMPSFKAASITIE